MNTSNITNYKPKDFSELLGVSVKTLQRWDREGTLKANRTPTNRRYYTYAQYLQFKGINIGNDKRQVVIYARVFTRNQKDDLLNQVAFLRQFCNAKGIIVDQCMFAQIEKGTANPSLGVLGKITSGLRMEFQTLIDAPREDFCLVSPKEIFPTKELEGQYKVWTCFPYEDSHSVEVYRIDIEPGGIYMSGSHGEKTREYITLFFS